MKRILTITILLITISFYGYSQSNILEARQMGIGATVTVVGIATNGDELGIIRYLQDETAGIAAYGSAVGVVNRGDSVSITGTLKSYNQLLEIDPITNVTVISTGNPVPDPAVITPDQLAEDYEGQLIQINDAVFTDGGQIFSGNNLYTFTSNGQTGSIYVKTGQDDIVGTLIPSAPVIITGLCSQFDYSNPNEGYQIVVRDIDDIYLPSSIYFTDILVNSEFTSHSLEFDWPTNIEGTTEIYYGETEETVYDNVITIDESVINHNIQITDLLPGDVTWVQAFSVSENDTAFSGVMSFATISNSSGNMLAYFNTPVDNSYSTGVNAVYLHNLMDDTLISYINRAKYTIDFTMYNFNNTGLSNVSDALIAAADRGVRVRAIGCGTTLNLGIEELEGTAVNVLIGPDDYERDGIMHNKFIIFDAESDDANDPLVWTGSTNVTEDQIDIDANNVIIIQDQSLAKAYVIEFEEMWGSHGALPDITKAKFGENKRNNTPHMFEIGGKDVECYFSPSDGVNDKIVDVIGTADNDLSVATMLITRYAMAEAIADRNSDDVACNVITNNEGNNDATVNQILQEALTSHNTYDDITNGILHHKFMVVDQGAPSSDPMTFTGSHNWSASADNVNDENTVIIHDPVMANVYYQAFVQRFVDNGGVLHELTNPPVANDDDIETVIDQTVTAEVLLNDEIEAPVVLSIIGDPANGTAYIPFANTNVINYQPNDDFYGVDTIEYKIAYEANESLYATAKVIVTVIDNSSITSVFDNGSLKVYPNPAENMLNIDFNAVASDDIQVALIDISGRRVMNMVYKANFGGNTINIDVSDYSRGVYFLSVDGFNKKVVIK